MCTKNQAIEILGKVYNASLSVYDSAVKEAYLYGSYARGDYHAESDVDVLLIVDVPQETVAAKRNAIAYIASELSLKYGVTVSVSVKPLLQFERFANILPFYKNVLSEGIRHAV
ncbi:MAG: nucleotidyltransferase domain-containing protein [Ruminococcaceae bacterium]|nr:nucleotidyltransferase domain-containing protein [Oscillospiraceae bacterium]